MRICASLLVSILLAACANAPSALPPDVLFYDRLFASPTERISADDVFAMSEKMRHYVRTEMAGPLRSKGLQRGLIDALYNRGQLKLDYDAQTTRNAAQAFEARAGNCLSLVIMTAAFAKELGLQVYYQSAIIPETWSRSGALYFASGHVNLTLGNRFNNRGGSSIEVDRMTIDFLPPEEVRGLRTRDISEETVVAMYMNNRAAEALDRGELDNAYWWARKAIGHAPGFLSAYNTLGVIYLHHGNLAEAERAFKHVLQSEPRNTRAMFNLAQSLGRQGRNDESATLRQRLAQIDPYPPFHFFNQGLAAMEKGEYQMAQKWFSREVERADYNHEFHYWLAVASFRLGDIQRANEHLASAVEKSSSRNDQALYAAKLAWLRSQRHQ